MLGRGQGWLWGLLVIAGCSGEAAEFGSESNVSSCMKCHNGSPEHDYAGPGIENPHPFGDAAQLDCVVCHGGNGEGEDRLASHIPPPPEIGDREFQENNREAWFNRLTLTGIDTYEDYTVDGVSYTALDYLQFINPGDLRVVSEGKSCGQCHGGHAECVETSLLATEAGMLSGALFAAGIDNKVPASQGVYGDTAADVGFREVTDEDYDALSAVFGAVPNLEQFPVYSVRGDDSPEAIHNNPDYLVANGVANGRSADGRLVTGSPLANLYHEQVAFTCGDCHLGSAGANNRYGDYRSSGCTSCHMPYSLDGRSRSLDPTQNKLEPLDPDDIDDGEVPHVRGHRIISVARTESNGEITPGIDDYACAGCHQGSNRTVMQYWGIRLDQNQDVRRGNQYPAQPASYQDTSGDERLFDPEVGNNTFNGRNRRQYLRFEDYDGDGRDDTPADVHYEAGMGCIDCHGSHDMHGGDVENPDDAILSRMEQAVSIRCEDCHGSVAAYAQVQPGTTYAGEAANVGVDSEGFAMRHVTQDANGDYYMTSRLTGKVHYLPQTRDYVVDTGQMYPGTDTPLYSQRASFAMGRDDGNAATGIGPQQAFDDAGPDPHSNFMHADTMDCASCHSAWTNTCMGCHLEGEYVGGNRFSNITGEEIVFQEDNADFTYQSPLFFQLGVDDRGKITQTSSNTKMFFRWEDQQSQTTERMGFSDRRGKGASPAVQFPGMSHNAMMAHSIRGRVTDENEGNRYCVSCHLTTNSVATYGTEYDAFRSAMQTGDWASLDSAMLTEHFGQNTGNQMDSPLFVHMVAGLGSGLFLFDVQGRPVNDIDDHDDRAGTDNVPPNSVYDPANVFYNLDRIVLESGLSTASSNHAMIPPANGAALRDGADDLDMAGPLGARILELLTDPNTGLVLDSWLDADGAPQGSATTHITD